MRGVLEGPAPSCWCWVVRRRRWRRWTRGTTRSSSTVGLHRPPSRVTGGWSLLDLDRVDDALALLTATAYAAIPARPVHELAQLRALRLVGRARPPEEAAALAALPRSARRAGALHRRPGRAPRAGAPSRPSATACSCISGAAPTSSASRRSRAPEPRAPDPPTASRSRSGGYLLTSRSTAALRALWLRYGVSPHKRSSA